MTKLEDECSEWLTTHNPNNVEHLTTFVRQKQREAAVRLKQENEKLKALIKIVLELRELNKVDPEWVDQAKLLLEEVE